ncbi:hypothetical protein DYB28_011238 [Aphanomyces astaci]|uniref:RING-type E3 ubiquitin transferase n=1 Tax=Aphanomyces astaci TaxID=112090 RepID=A0A9X8DJX2_APHAT|nr:hypothetical protein DYB28_011238 [Aphanomyces astaci]
MEFEADDDDEWVWPNELKEARLMEGILRCQVCGEFLSGPVLLRECRHSFCSECVRKHLLARGTNGCCPECKCACSSSDLIPNRPLEQLVGFFRALKPKVLHLASTSQGSGDGATLASLSTSDLTDTATASTSTDITARMPTTSYNFLKDSQIRQLLKSAGLLAILPTSKDSMITCHKELDTMNPKNASQVRAEVVTKFRQRQHETAAKASTRRSLGLRPDDPIEKAITRTSALNDNFRKLAQQVKAQKANAATTQPNPPAASPSTASPAKTPSKAPEEQAATKMPTGPTDTIFEREDDEETYGDGDENAHRDRARSLEDLDLSGDEMADLHKEGSDAAAKRTLDPNMLNELLLVCSNLGVMTETEDGGTMFTRGEDCEEWVHDLQRAIRRDHATYRLVGKTLGRWKILQKKLLPLLINHQNDW